MEQGTPEWHQIRCGKVTASRVADVIAKTKSGPSASRANYMAQLIVERLTGEPTQGFTSSAMQHGVDTEPLARVAYELKYNRQIEQIAFVDHPRIANAGASPDGMFENALIEIKCPNTSTHLETILTGKINQNYITQIQWQMACTGREFCDFISFDNRVPENLQLYVQRVNRDGMYIQMLENEVIDFLNEVEKKVKELTNYVQKDL